MQKTIFLIILFFIFFSCEERSNPNNDIEIKNIDSLLLKRNNIYTKYNIPLPIEIFQEINKSVKYKSNLLNPIPSIYKDYSTSTNAYKLGIYSAELAYCTLLENGQKTIDYSKTCAFYTHKLNIDAVYNKNYIERLKNNINKRDSLIKITNIAYTKSCNLIENSGMKNVIPFTIYGGWIEAIYLAFFSELKTDINYEEYRYKIIEIAKIDSLVSYLYNVQIESSAYYYNKEIKGIITELIELRNLFNDIKKNKTNNFTQIENKIIELRNK